MKKILNINIQKKKNSTKPKLLFSLILIFICLFFFFFNSILYKDKYISDNNNINYNKQNYNINKIGKFEIDEINPEEYQTDILNRIKNRLKGPMLMGLNGNYIQVILQLHL